MQRGAGKGRGRGLGRGWGSMGMGSGPGSGRGAGAGEGFHWEDNYMKPNPNGDGSMVRMTAAEIVAKNNEEEFEKTRKLLLEASADRARKRKQMLDDPNTSSFERLQIRAKEFFDQPISEADSHLAARNFLDEQRKKRSKKGHGGGKTKKHLNKKNNTKRRR